MTIMEICRLVHVYDDKHKEKQRWEARLLTPEGEKVIRRVDYIDPAYKTDLSTLFSTLTDIFVTDRSTQRTLELWQTNLSKLVAELMQDGWEPASYEGGSVSMMKRVRSQSGIAAPSSEYTPLQSAPTHEETLEHMADMLEKATRPSIRAESTQDHVLPQPEFKERARPSSVNNQEPIPVSSQPRKSSSSKWLRGLVVGFCLLIITVFSCCALYLVLAWWR